MKNYQAVMYMNLSVRCAWKGLTNLTNYRDIVYNGHLPPNGHMKTLVILLALLEEKSVSDKDFTFSFILLLLLLLLSEGNPFPNIGAMNIELNSRNCNEIRVIVIVFMLEVCI